MRGGGGISGSVFARQKKYKKKFIYERKLLLHKQVQSEKEAMQTYATS